MNKIKDIKEIEILIVEDNEGDFTLIQDYIQERFLIPKITWVKNFKEAQFVLVDVEFKIDIVLLDLTLLDKCGKDLINELIPLCQAIPLVILTGYSDMEFSITSLSLGVSDYLIKVELDAASLYTSILYNIERKKSQIHLETSEKRYHDLFHLSPIPMWVFDNKTLQFMDVNIAAEMHYGYTREELFELTYVNLTHPADIEDDLACLRLLANGSISNFNKEKRYFHKNGSIIWGDVTVSLVKNNLGKPIHYISQILDITLKKEIEEANKLIVEENNRGKALQLNEAQNLYRLLADNMVDLVCAHSLDAKFQYVSPSIHYILGYLSEDLIGLSPMEFVHPDDREKLKSSIQHFITEKEDFSAEMRFRNKEGHYIWFETKGSLVKENGIPVSYHSSTRNITKGKHAEFAIEKMLEQERKLNELRTNLVSTISHEFRTPMTNIRASAELIMMHLEYQKIENFPVVQNKINTITKEIDRIVELMNTVLIVSKNDLGKTNFLPIIFDLKQTCLDTIELSNFDFTQGRKVKTFFDGDSFLVLADKNLMEYTLFNLFNNAFKYSQGFGGDIILNLFTTEKFITIEVIDFGIGIPKEDQMKLFNTFFRASNTNGIQGTGLGLYIVKTFTEKNSGLIQIESELGKGTKVTLQFPKPNIIKDYLNK